MKNLRGWRDSLFPVGTSTLSTSAGSPHSAQTDKDDTRTQFEKLGIDMNGDKKVK